jgi:hypothetical protein
LSTSANPSGCEPLVPPFWIPAIGIESAPRVPQAIGAVSVPVIAVVL